MKGLVTDITTNQKAITPLIVHFQNGKITEGHESDLKSQIYSTEDNGIKMAIYSKSMLYTGKVSDKDSFYNNFIVVHNKTTNKVRLIQTENILMSPYLKKSVDSVEENVNTNNMNELNKQFGSKKTKRYTEQKERFKINIENVKEQLEQTVADIRVDDDFLSKSKVNDGDGSLAPLINRDASTKEQVYDLGNLVPISVLNTLEEEAVNVFETIAENSNLKPFCKTNIQNLTDVSSASNLQKCKLFVYVDYLLKFLSTAARSINRKYVVCPTSRDVDQHILNNFTISTGANRTRPISMRDKAICYTLVLSMIASNYELNLDTIAKDLKLGLKKLQEMSRALGFTCIGSTQAVLKLPLPPVSTQLRSRKRK